MPLLDDEALLRLRAMPPAPPCIECGHLTFSYYCRECDEYFGFNHSPLCKVGEGDYRHNDHRIC